MKTSILILSLLFSSQFVLAQETTKSESKRLENLQIYISPGISINIQDNDDETSSYITTTSFHINESFDFVFLSESLSFISSLLFLPVKLAFSLIFYQDNND